ncbi:MAG: tRNA lysidine(34) synthetase TilS [Planctomycetota bacterium]
MSNNAVVPPSAIPGLIRAAIDREGALPPGSAFGVGFSGGADSTVLLHTLAAIDREDGRGWRITALHLDHGLRPGSDAEAEHCRRFAADRGIAAIAKRVDAGLYARTTGVSIETAGRACRLAFFREHMETVCLGHQRDDQVETVLWHIIRGAGVRGLGGMAPVTQVAGLVLVRPMLDIPADAIRDHARGLNLPFLEDPSNLDQVYTRNRIRHGLMPLIREAYPDAGAHIAGLAGHARRVWAAVREEAEQLRRVALKPVEGGMAIDLAVFRQAPPGVRDALLLALIEENGGEATAGAIAAAGELADGAAQGTRIRDIGRGLRLTREYDLLTIGCPSEPAAATLPEGVTLPIPGECRIGPDGTIQAAVLPLAPGQPRPAATPWEEYLDLDRVGPGPFTVRTRREGDRFHPLGGPGSRKLQDLLVDRKVPEGLRDRVYLVESAGTIIWVIGHRIAETGRITPRTTRLVRLTARFA